MFMHLAKVSKSKRSKVRAIKKGVMRVTPFHETIRIPRQGALG